MSLRFVIAIVWGMPLALIVGLLYHEFMMPSAAPLETNRAMRARMCREHADLARIEPGNDLARTAVGECLAAGYISRTDGNIAID